MLYFRFLATGDSYKTIGFSYRVGASTVQYIIPNVCQALWESLVAEYLPIPDENSWRDIANSFEKNWNFPNCIGALDGKHIVIQAPHNSGSLYYNYKHTFLISLSKGKNKGCVKT